MAKPTKTKTRVPGSHLDNVARIASVIESNAAKRAALSSAPYDGLHGRLPEWIPEPAILEFEQARSHLLRIRVKGQLISHEVLLTWLHDYLALGEPGSPELELEDEDFRMVGVLARLYAVVSRGPIQGLKLLSGTTAAMGHAFQQNQGVKAKLPRGAKTDMGERIPDIISELALAPEFEALSAKELWGHLYSKLDEGGLDPKETTDPKGTLMLTYDVPERKSAKGVIQDGRKSLRYSSFCTTVSKARNARN